MLFPRSFLASFVTILVTVLSCQTAKSELNQSVKRLVPLLNPIKASESNSGGDFQKAVRQMTNILTYMGRNHDSYGKDGGDLLEIAIDSYGKDKFSARRGALILSSIKKAWEDSQALGLFDEKGTFTYNITNGPETGKKASFEYIIPPGVDPVFSTEITNLRLVTPASKRKEGSEDLSVREEEHFRNLEGIKEEILYGPEDDLGRNKKENLELWEQEVAKHEGALEEIPRVRLEGSIDATPSSKSGGVWKVEAQLMNRSSHPINVQLDYYIFGMSDQANKLFILAKGSFKDLKLRKSEVWVKEISTKPQKAYAELATKLDWDNWRGNIDKRPKKFKPTTKSVKLRGWVLIAKHKDKEIEWIASQPSIYEYVKDAGKYASP